MTAVHLHVHSEYSLLDGACKIDALAERAAGFEQPALGLTDHGVMNGAVEHYKACKKHGIKPIIGLEAYLVDDISKTEAVRYERNHLTLLARSDEGFRNLVKLSSAGYLEGFRRGKANVDMGLLARHAEGVIALSGCLQSRFCRRLVADIPAEARAHADELVQVFGPEDVYFEIQNNGVPEQDKANEGIVRIAQDLGRPLVATADVHYLRREDYDNHRALLCVQTKSTLAAPKLSFDTNEFFLKDSREMERVVRALAGGGGQHRRDRGALPGRAGAEQDAAAALPDARTGVSEGDHLRRLAEEGLQPPLRRTRRRRRRVERLETELGVIGRMGFEAYFLIVWDFVKFAKDNGIAVGPGRGSAAGSIVSYCLDITDVDPLAYDLLFERFLNPERVSMPDIDIDFSVKGRDQVIRYVADKYGQDRVAQIITFGKMLPRAATRDAARVLGHDYGAGDRLAKLIPEPVMGRSKTFDEYLVEEPELKRAYETEPEARQIIDTARGLEGIVRNNSIHAAAVVIADRPLTDIVPLQMAEDKPVTQYSMKPIEEIGLLKMDFLGLRNLDVIEACLDIVERSAGERPDMTALPLDDRKTYEMMARGDSVGVFQFESDGMRDALRKVKPTEFEDLVALVALYRPGAMRYIDTYARHKRNPDAIGYADDRLRPITESDLRRDPLPGAVDADRHGDRRLLGGRGGRPAQGDRQEAAAGDGGAQGPLLRGLPGQRHRRAGDQRALGRQRGRGRLQLQPLARRLLRADLLPHGLAQGQLPGRVHGGADLVGHVDQGQGAVLRLALRGDGHRGAAAGRQRVRPRLRRRGGLHPLRARRRQERGLRRGRRDHPGPRGGRPLRLDLGLLPPRGLARGEQEGDRVAREVRGARLDRRHPPRDARGAPAGPGGRRQGPARRPARPGLVLRHGGQRPRSPQPELPVPPLPDDRESKGAMEKETLGLFLSSHPLKEVRPALRARVDCSLAELRGKKDGESVTVGGVIAECKRIRTKKGDPMMFATLDDLEGQVEMLVFNSSYAENEGKVAVDAVVLVRGRVDHKEQGETKLIAQEVERFEPSRRGGGEGDRGGRPPSRWSSGSPCRSQRDVPPSFLDDLKTVVQHHPGDHELLLLVGERSLLLGESVRGGRRPTGRLPRRAGRAWTGLHWARAQHGRDAGAPRVPPVLRLLRPHRPPIRLHSVGLPLPLPV